MASGMSSCGGGGDCYIDDLGGLGIVSDIGAQ